MAKKPHKTNKMKKLVIYLTMMLISVSLHSQSRYFQTDLPTDFASIGFQVDPGGSLDKEGLNIVLSFSAVDFDWLEWEAQLQTLFTGKYAEDGGWQLDYLDFQFGPGVLIPINTNISLTPGVHLGFIYRGANNVRTHDAGGIIYGLTGKFRYWIGKRKNVALILSTAYDRRPELGEFTFILNNRFGIEVML